MRTIATAVRQSTMEIVAWFEVINNALPSRPNYSLFLHVHCISLRANYDFFFCLDMVEQRGKG